MRFIIMHKTNAHWESGAIPSAALIARVGTLLGELAKTGALLGAEGLRATSQGVRLKFSHGTPAVIRGPFEGDHELPSGFTIVRARSIEEAIAWASRQGAALGDVEIDIRPVTEPSDIGMAPPPDAGTSWRYMILRKATAETEAGTAPSPAQRAELARLIEEAVRTNTHVATETMRPSARGRRYKSSRNGISTFDGPFVESKELIAGYVVVAADSLDDADRLARLYIDAVGAAEVDVRELD